MPIYAGLLAKYGELLELPPHTKRVSLLEGNTPLIPAKTLVQELGGGFELWIKYEGLNPTGSFKDRGMTAAVGEALGRGAKTVICASTGNTAASAAAYGQDAVDRVGPTGESCSRKIGRSGGLRCPGDSN